MRLICLPLAASGLPNCVRSTWRSARESACGGTARLCSLCGSCHSTAQSFMALRICIVPSMPLVRRSILVYTSIRMLQFVRLQTWTRGHLSSCNVRGLFRHNTALLWLAQARIVLWVSCSFAGQKDYQRRILRSLAVANAFLRVAYPRDGSNSILILRIPMCQTVLLISAANT